MFIRVFMMLFVVFRNMSPSGILGIPHVAEWHHGMVRIAMALEYSNIFPRKRTQNDRGTVMFLRVPVMLFAVCRRAVPPEESQ